MSQEDSKHDSESAYIVNLSHEEETLSSLVSAGHSPKPEDYEANLTSIRRYWSRRTSDVTQELP